MTQNPAAIYLRPDTALRINNVASIMLSQPGLDMAAVMGLFHAALELCPDDPRILANFAAALDKLPDTGPLMRDVCARCLDLLEDGHVAPELYLNYSLALHKCYDTHGALDAAELAVESAHTNNVGQDKLYHYYTNLANALHRSGDAYSAIWWLTKVVDLPLVPPILRLQAQMARGSLYLQLSDWDHAVKDLDCRFAYYNTTNGWLGHPDLRNAPNMWNGDGELLRGKSVLVYLEQGLGDQIQHCRLVQWMAKAFQPARITIACDPKLRVLVQSLAGVHPATVPDSHPVPNPGDYDYLVPVISLIGERHRHGFHPMGDPVRGYLGDNPTYAQHRGPGAPFRIGVYFQGNPQNTCDWARSCPLSHFYSLALALKGLGLNVEWRAFQPYNKDAPEGVFDGWDQGEIPLADHWADAMAECGMDWTVPQLKDLDLFLGVESGQMHLCLAATRTPCMLVHTNAMDFRWHHADQLYGGPSAGVYHHRQTIPGDWPGLFSSLVEPIRDMILGPVPSAEPTLTGHGIPLPVNTAPGPTVVQGSGNKLNDSMKGQLTWQ